MSVVFRSLRTLPLATVKLLPEAGELGAQRGGVSGWLALNGGALGAGLFEASSGSDAERAVGALSEGRWLAAAGSALLATPAGKAAKGVKRIFSARVLERMATAADDFHNFPQQLADDIFCWNPYCGKR